MATYNTSGSGDWNNNATWGGGGFPIAGDTANIRGNDVVTIPAGVTAATAVLNIGTATDNTTGTSTLINNGTLLTSGNVGIGGGTNRDGKYVFGPSSVWTVSAGSISWNNCYIESTATPSTMAEFGGTATIAGTAGRRQDIRLSNVKFLHSGSTTFRLSDTLGIMTSHLDVENCIWAGTSGLVPGSADTPTGVHMRFNNCDFRDIGTTNTIVFSRVTGVTGDWYMRGCTFNKASGLLTITTSVPGFEFSGNVGVQLVLGSTGVRADGWTITGNLLTMNTNGGSFINLSDAGVANTVTYNYFVTTGNNPHPIVSGGSGGTGTHTITHNVMDGKQDGGTFTDKGDILIPGLTPLEIDYIHNVVVGTGEHVAGAVHPDFANGITHRNNTTVGTADPAVTTTGHMYTPEGTPNAGTISIRNNLHLGNGRVGEISINGSSSGGDQIISYSDFNNFFNLASPYNGGTDPTISAGNTAKTIPAANTAPARPPYDMQYNPKFFSLTRTLATWNAFFGSGTATDAAAITYLLGINGYRGTPNFDQQGTVSTNGPTRALDWVRYGASPTNLLLRGAGDPADGSPDVGAMPVRCMAGTFF